MKIKDLYKLFLESSGVSTDSRNLKPGSIFFALKGENFDGNDFAAEAIQKGCELAVVDRPDIEGSDHIVRVGSSIETLQNLAAFHRKQKNIIMLAITGSNGKTTTKELVSAVMAKRYRVLHTTGNLNNHIGVPLTLLDIKDQEFGIVEMGANHPGEIALLSKIIAPDFGLITNIGKAHLEGFKTIEGVLEAKGELYDYLVKNGRKAFLNMNDDLLFHTADRMRLDFIPYNDKNIYGEIIAVFPLLECKIYIEGRGHQVNTRLVGAYNLENIIPAVAIGKYFNIPEREIFDAIESYVPEMQRSQLIEGKRNRIILDAYNANPTSMRKSISDFIHYTSGPKMFILGDMLELGEYEHQEHLDLVGWLENRKLENVILVGDAFMKTQKKFPGYRYFKNVLSCISYLEDENFSGYHILIKGSRKMALESITGHC